MTVQELRDKLEGVPGNIPVAVSTDAEEFYNVAEKAVRLGVVEFDGFDGELDPMYEAEGEPEGMTAHYLLIG